MVSFKQLKRLFTSCFKRVTKEHEKPRKSNKGSFLSKFKRINTLHETEKPTTIPSQKKTISTSTQSTVFSSNNCSQTSKVSRTTTLREKTCDKKVFTPILKQYLQPFKTYYELEWRNVPSIHHASSTVWLQLDKQTANGIERVRRLGFSDLDVCLDDNLTRYINNTFLGNQKADSILIEILFSNSKKTVSPSNGTYNNVQLLRLRRVHWWTKDYNLVRAYLP